MSGGGDAANAVANDDDIHLIINDLCLKNDAIMGARIFLSFCGNFLRCRFLWNDKKKTNKRKKFIEKPYFYILKKF